jgi:cysteine-rich repeat protein
VGSEGCDDGNTSFGDGCSTACQRELGWTCSGEPSDCDPICGDGRVVTGEGCDDQNLNENDGCLSTCLVSPGYQCTGQGATTVCTTTCGDGIPAGTEGCDDGALVSGDGCSATCTVEANHQCHNTPSACDWTCTLPSALFEDNVCEWTGLACTISAYTGGTYACRAPGANAYYASCSTYTQCAAGSTCANLGSGAICLPFCDASGFEGCPDGPGGPALCLFYYPSGQTTSGVCAANECDVPNQTGCSTGWCDLITQGVALCETTDAAGQVATGGVCSQTSGAPAAQRCVPGNICINTGTNATCFRMCHLSDGTPCPGGQTCYAWDPPDSVYGYCDL